MKSWVDKVLTRYTKIDIFEGNSEMGHRLYALFGVFVGGTIDFILGIQSEPTILSFGPMLAQIPAVLLPYGGYDRKGEWWQAHVVTFFPSLALGFMFGGLIASQLLSIDSIDEIRVGALGFEGVGQSIFSVSNFLGTLTAVRVIWGYIETGFMTRDLDYEKWVFLDPPFFCRQLIGKLQGKKMREHIAAAEFITAFLDRDKEALLREDKRACNPEDYSQKELNLEPPNPGILQKLIILANCKDLWEPAREELLVWFDPAKAAKARNSSSTAYRRPRRGGGSLRK